MKSKGLQLNNDWELAVSVVRDQDGLIVTGLAVGDVTYQNQAVILMTHKGEIKEDPAVGIGISDLTLDNDLLAWKHAIRQQLEREGLAVNSIEITRDNLKIDAKYPG